MIFFGYLGQMREDKAMKRLMLDITARENPTCYTVQNFIAKIMEQCQNVYLKHERIQPEEYIKDSAFRGLVWEMVELQVRTFIGLTSTHAAP